MTKLRTMAIIALAVGMLTTPGCDKRPAQTDSCAELFAAVDADDVARVARLLGDGADVNCAGEGGQTPLHAAVLAGSLEMAKCLVDHGADVTASDSRGKTPVHLASGADQNTPMLAVLMKTEPPTTSSSIGPPTTAELDQIGTYTHSRFGYRVPLTPDWTFHESMPDPMVPESSMAVFTLRKVWCAAEQENVTNVATIRVYPMPPDSSVDDVAEKYKLLTADGRESLEEIECPRGRGFVQIQAWQGKRLKSQFRALLANDLGYIVELVATPGSYEIDLPLFEQFAGAIEYFKPEAPDGE